MRWRVKQVNTDYVLQAYVECGWRRWLRMLGLPLEPDFRWLSLRRVSGEMWPTYSVYASGYVKTFPSLFEAEREWKNYVDEEDRKEALELA